MALAQGVSSGFAPVNRIRPIVAEPPAQRLSLEPGFYPEQRRIHIEYHLRSKDAEISIGNIVSALCCREVPADVGCQQNDDQHRPQPAPLRMSADLPA